MKYDGSINIDTKIDEKGFNDGIKGIEKSMEKTGKSLTKGIDTKAIGGKLKAMGMVLKGIFAVVGSAIMTGIVAALSIALSLLIVIVTILEIVVAVITAAATAFTLFTNVMYKGMSHSSYLYNDFRNMHSLFLDLKGALMSAFAPLWLAVMPTVVKIVNWLIEMLNILAQVLAVIFGQSTYMKYVAGSAQAAQEATGGMKKDLEDTEKAAKGALAAFDEINVLRQDQPVDEPGVGAGGTGLGTMGEFVETPVDEGIAKKVEEIKQKIIDTWNTIKEWAINTWNTIKENAMKRWEEIVALWGRIKTWWQENVSGPLGASMSNAWEEVKNGFSLGWQAVVGGWEGFKTWWKINVTDPFITNWDQTWAKIKVKAYLAWLNIRATWIRAKAWFQEHFLDPLKETFAKTWEKIKEGFGKAWDGMVEIVKGVINKIIDHLNNLIGGTQGAINSLIEALNSLGGFVPGWGGIPTISIPKIPKLAQGAVIPPNSAFLAMMGDQRHGRNIEAPEDLIRQIVREEAGANQDVTINFGGSMAALVREMRPYIEKEDARIGTSLIKGSVT